MIVLGLKFSLYFNNDNYIIIQKLLLKGIIDFYWTDSNLIIKDTPNR